VHEKAGGERVIVELDLDATHFSVLPDLRKIVWRSE
jgi:hypothetical protein